MKSDLALSLVLASRVSQERRRQNVTQQTLAELSGVTYSSIRHFERTGKIGLERFIGLLRALGKLGELEDFLALQGATQKKNLEGE